MLSVYDALKLMNADPAICDDALRAAWIQSVSSFDYHNHEVFAIEAVHRFSNGINATKIAVPFEIFTESVAEQKKSLFSEHYRLSNSYKSFVAAEKIGEAMSCFVAYPWQKVAIHFNAAGIDQMTEVEMRTTINNIWSRRNKIAHEADINPSMAATELWPIYREDVAYNVDFMLRLAGAILSAIAHLDTVPDT